MRPDLTRYDDFIDEADRRIEAAARRRAVHQQLAACRASRSTTSPTAIIEDGPPVDFRVNVNPFVTWIWVGGAIGVLGALIAIWPAPDARRRRVSDVYAARLARDLGRA